MKLISITILILFSFICVGHALRCPKDTFHADEEGGGGEECRTGARVNRYLHWVNCLWGPGNFFPMWKVDNDPTEAGHDAMCSGLGAAYAAFPNHYGIIDLEKWLYVRVGYCQTGVSDISMIQQSAFTLLSVGRLPPNDPCKPRGFGQGQILGNHTLLQAGNEQILLDVRHASFLKYEVCQDAMGDPSHGYMRASTWAVEKQIHLCELVNRFNDTYMPWMDIRWDDVKPIENFLQNGPPPPPPPGGNARIRRNEYDNFERLDENLNLYWTVLGDTKVRFGIEGKTTTGWVGFGIALPQAPMTGADVMFASIGNGPSEVLFDDRYNEDRQPPTLDVDLPNGGDDLTMISVRRTGDGWLVVEYERPTAKSDVWDQPIAEGPIDVIWAIGHVSPWPFVDGKANLQQHTLKGQHRITLVAVNAKKTCTSPTHTHKRVYWADKGDVEASTFEGNIAILGDAASTPRGTNDALLVVDEAAEAQSLFDNIRTTLQVSGTKTTLLVTEGTRAGSTPSTATEKPSHAPTAMPTLGPVEQSGCAVSTYECVGSRTHAFSGGLEYNVMWIVDCASNEVEFTLRAATSGWLGVGFHDSELPAASGRMSEADIYQCYKEGSEMKCTHRSGPPLDSGGKAQNGEPVTLASQGQLKSVSGEDINGERVVRFRRSLAPAVQSAADLRKDVYVLLALHESAEDISTYHSHRVVLGGKVQLDAQCGPATTATTKMYSSTETEPSSTTTGDDVATSTSEVGEVGFSFFGLDPGTSTIVLVVIIVIILLLVVVSAVSCIILSRRSKMIMGSDREMSGRRHSKRHSSRHGTFTQGGLRRSDNRRSHNGGGTRSLRHSASSGVRSGANTMDLAAQMESTGHSPAQTVMLSRAPLTTAILALLCVSMWSDVHQQQMSMMSFCEASGMCKAGDVQLMLSDNFNVSAHTSKGDVIVKGGTYDSVKLSTDDGGISGYFTVGSVSIRVNCEQRALLSVEVTRVSADEYVVKVVNVKGSYELKSGDAVVEELRVEFAKEYDGDITEYGRWRDRWFGKLDWGPDVIIVEVIMDVKVRLEVSHNPPPCGEDCEIYDVRFGDRVDAPMHGQEISDETGFYPCHTWDYPTWFTVENSNYIRVDPINEWPEHVHHMVVWGSDYMGAFQEGECWGSMGSGVTYAWAAGGESYSLPSGVAKKIKVVEALNYLTINMHYDNPSHTRFINDHSGLRFFVTKKTIASNSFADFLWLGFFPNFQNTSEFIENNQTGIPPGKTVQFYSTCIPGLNVGATEPIYIIGEILHMHKLGRRGWTQLAHNTLAVPPFKWQHTNSFIHDPSEIYDFNRQSLLPVDNVEVLPTDLLTTFCEWDSTGVSHWTYGADGSEDEMCMHGLLYTPAIPGQSLCHHAVGAGNADVARSRLPWFPDP